MEHRGWYSRGYLPHIDAPNTTQFLTWRQDDALPSHVVAQWKLELRDLPDGDRKQELASRIEKYCDEGHGSCVLRDPRAARAAELILLEHHCRLYKLHAWVVMPNHVHALLTPAEDVTLAEVLKRVKGASSHDVNKSLGRSGRLWEPDFFDRMIRDDKHYEAVRRYIEWNPVKAKLCSDPKLWGFSSCHPESDRRLEERAKAAYDDASRTEVRESGAE
jgi:REP element-mobilizing transposase RayT